MSITSPCTGVCKLDEATGWCLGCGRSGDEIMDWGSQPATWRSQAWEQIPNRLTALGVTARRLPWTTQDIRGFVVGSLEQSRGAWVVGVVGAVAEFSAAPDQSVDVTCNGDEIVARTQNAALRMLINDDIRALTFDPPEMLEPPRIVLAVKRERGRLAKADGVANLGPDTTPLMSDDAEDLFDLGLARKEARFCVRIRDGDAHRALIASEGLAFTTAMPHIAGPLLAKSPTRVVESALGRIEVQGVIPPPGGQSPAGSHTHLLPDHLDTGRALPVGMDLPRAYLPGAIFYPRGALN